MPNTNRIRIVQPAGRVPIADKRRPALVAGFIALGLMTVGVGLKLWTTYLWFEQDVHQLATLERMWAARCALFFGGFVLVFVVLSLLQIVAERIAPVNVVFESNDPLWLVRHFTARSQNLTRNLIAFVFSSMFGLAAASQWQNYLLFRYGPSGKVKGPTAFGHDVNFYLFRLPFLSWISSWLWGVAIVALLVTVGALVLNASLHLRGRTPVANRQATGLISVVLAACALTRALGFWCDRLNLATAQHRHYSGVGYVDRTVRSPAYLMMILASLLCALIFAANVSQRRLLLIIAPCAAWILLAPVATAVVPGIWQRFALSNELQKEAPSIGRTIAATRSAYQLENVEEVTPNYLDPDAVDPTSPPLGQPKGSNPVAAGAYSSDALSNISNVRLWDTNPLTDVTTKVFDSAQKVNPRYRIGQTDVTPGPVLDSSGSSEGAAKDSKTPTAWLLGVREIASDPSASWINRRLVYTHGFGLASAPVNVAANGEPVFNLRDLPIVGSPALTEARVFYGEDNGDYAIVNTRTKSIDVLGGKTSEAPDFTGDSGVQLSSSLRRVAFALNYSDLDLLVSKSIKKNSKLLSHRTITERISTVAPFLTLDSDPYPVIYKGRIKWVVEAYLGSRNYPNSQAVDFDAYTRLPTVARQFAYVRNSVRVIVDAYSGDMNLFITDRNDPIAMAYLRAFPSLFDLHSFETAFPGMDQKLRYPGDILNVRTQLWGRYHVKSAAQFYDESDQWAIGKSVTKVLAETPSSQASGLLPAPGVPEQLTSPQYVVTNPWIAGNKSASPEFLTQQSLVAKGRDSVEESASDQRLRGLVFAESLPGRYGHLLSVKIPSAFSYNSPAAAGQEFSSDTVAAKNETELGRGGSSVVNGEVQIVPLGNSLLYVRPMYVQADDQNKQRPRLRFVEARFGSKIGVGPTYLDALRQIFGPSFSLEAGLNSDTSSSSQASVSNTNPTPGSASNTSASPVAGAAGSAKAAVAGTVGESANSGVVSLSDPNFDSANATPSDLLKRAVGLNDLAARSLTAGDLGTYKTANDESARMVKLASERLAAGK